MIGEVLGVVPGRSGEYFFWCPGCQECHVIGVKGEVVDERLGWAFTGDLKSPTFKPSYLTRTENRRCHLFITDGQICYEEDCSHHLKGRNIDMVEWDNV